jgi:chemotaxis signal transduction protein
MTTDFFALVDAIAHKEQELHDLRRELSLLHASTPLPTGECMVLRCVLKEHAVALLASEVDEVLNMAELVTSPSSPAWLMGLLSVGPRRVPVIDLFARESGVRRSPDPAEFIVLARTRTASCGLVVDAIDGLAQIASRDVYRPEPEAPFGAYVRGVVNIAGKPVLLLSAIPVLLPDEPVNEKAT